MNNITTKQFQILTDNQLVWDFMTEIFSKDFSNGVPAPFFEYALTSSWMDKRYYICAACGLMERKSLHSSLWSRRLPPFSSICVPATRN